MKKSKPKAKSLIRFRLFVLGGSRAVRGFAVAPVPGHWFSETREEKTSGLRYLNAWHQAPPIPAAGFIFKRVQIIKSIRLKREGKAFT
jgi:hypothetical protein